MLGWLVRRDQRWSYQSRLEACPPERALEPTAGPESWWEMEMRDRWICRLE